MPCMRKLRSWQKIFQCLKSSKSKKNRSGLLRGGFSWLLANITANHISDRFIRITPITVLNFICHLFQVLI